MSAHTFYLKPVDTFFFKGQQISEAGNDNNMFGIFPPRPNTVYGALRSAYIHEHIPFYEFEQETNLEVKKWMGTPRSLGDFRVTYCGLTYENDLLFPLPLDYQVIEKDEKLQAYPLQLVCDDMPSSHNTGWLLTSKIKEKSKSSTNLFMKRNDWKRNILSTSPVDHLYKLTDLVTFENKTGIALDYEKRTSKSSYFYQMNYLRFLNDSSLYVYSPISPDFDNIHLVRLGGENRPWILEQKEETFKLWNKDELNILKQKILQSGIAKIILLSPAIWENGSQPKSYDGNSVILPNGMKVKLLTAAIGRPTLYGGWDIVHHRPKKRYYMVPEGSVLYVQVHKDQVDNMIELANGFSFSDYGNQEGFGFAVVAPVKH